MSDLDSAAAYAAFTKFAGFSPAAVPSSEARMGFAEFRRTYNRMLRASLMFYASEVLRGPPEYGGRFLVARHHAAWDEIIRTQKRALILASRDHGKSLAMSFAYPLWMADKQAPGRLGYIVSGSERLAKNHLLKIKQEIVGGGEGGGPNPRLAHLLPFKRDNQTTLQFANNSTIEARGFGGRIRGPHPWWMVGDDMLEDEHIYSEWLRKKSIDFFLSAIVPMIVPQGQLVVVGTPMHVADLYGYLESTGVYHTSRWPALTDGVPLWPERYDFDALMSRKRELKSEIRWSREYLVRPITDEASLFPAALFEAPGVLQPYRLGLPAAYWDGLGYDRYIGVDLAMSSSTNADYFVIFVMAFDPATRERWVVDIIRRKGLGYQEQVDAIVRACDRYSPVFAFVEANQYQRVITDMVVRATDAPIKAFYTTGRKAKQVSTERRGMTHVTANKNAIDQGVPSLRMLLENGKLKIPWAEETRDVVEVWIGEMQAFGWLRGKLQGIGTHDDTVMAGWICERAIQAGTERVRALFGPEEEARALPEPGEEEPDFFGSGGVPMPGIPRVPNFFGLG